MLARVCSMRSTAIMLIMRRMVSWISADPDPDRRPRRLPVAGEDRHRVELLEADEARAQAVVHVVVVVGDLVGQVGQLGLEEGWRPSRKRRPMSPSSSAFFGEQCLRMPSRVSCMRLRPLKSA
jgi:hypothetical protein